LVQQTQNMELEYLAKKINEFDWGYEMSDDDSKWVKWNHIQKEINKELLELTFLELCEVVSFFNHLGMRVFERYFITNLIKKHDILHSTRLY